MPVDRRKNLGCKFVLFEQAAELQQRRRVGCRLSIKVDANEATDRLAVVYCVFDPFVGQAETLLRHVHAQHARQANRRAPYAFSLRVKRRDQLMQLRPRGHLIDLCKKAVAPRQLFLGSVFEVRKALLHDRLNGGGHTNIVSGLARGRNRSGRINQRFPNGSK